MAAEANLILQRHRAAVILARQAAMWEVKRRRQKLGLRETLPYSTLAKLAHEWLDDHPELIAEAALSPIVQNLQLTHRRRTVGRKGKSLFTTHVQNGGQHAWSGLCISAPPAITMKPSRFSCRLGTTNQCTRPTSSTCRLTPPQQSSGSRTGTNSTGVTTSSSSTSWASTSSQTSR
jgi:hypothetical protein